MKTLFALFIILTAPLAFAGGWTDFTITTFQKATAQVPGSAAFSPYSLAGALRVLQPALQGPSLEKLNGLLKDEDASQISFKQAKFIHANSVWFDHTIHPTDNFRMAMRDVHGESNAVDFSKGTEAAKLLNGWSERSTMGMIPKIVDPDKLKGVLVLLADAVAIDAKWLTDGEFTESKHAFHGVKKSQSAGFLEAPEGMRNFLKADKMQMVEIDMAGDDVVFGMLIPDAGQKFPAWKKALTAEKLRKWSADAKPEERVVIFPALDVRSQIDLKPLFSELGLGVLFEAGSQLPGLAATPPLHLYWAKQDAYFSANKQGVKAAAVTTMAASKGTGGPPQILLVDRPFVYYLTDKAHNHILFMGQKTEP